MTTKMLGIFYSDVGRPPIHERLCYATFSPQLVGLAILYGIVFCSKEISQISVKNILVSVRGS